MTDIELINIAKNGLEKSYSPYSEFKVSAALLTDSGKVYSGCNIENSSYGATICAERVAIFKAISEGEKNFTKIAIVSKSNNEKFKDFAGDFTYPCGICIQVMVEFMIDGFVILQNKKSEIINIPIKELSPFSFKTI